MRYKRIPLGPLWTNSYTVDDDSGVAFSVDPGGDPGEILSYLKLEHLKLCAIILTHGHLDHILGVGALKKATGAKVYIPEADAPLLSDPNLSLASEFDEVLDPVIPDIYVHDGDKFNIGGISIQAIFTPGHTAGSTCYLLSQKEQMLLLSGDTLFADSIGRTDLAGGDPEAMVRSLQKLKEIRGDMPVLPGHGPETTLARERDYNPYMSMMA